MSNLRAKSHKFLTRLRNVDMMPSSDRFLALKEASMEKTLVLLFLLLLFFVAACDSVCEAQIYKWVDEKGTVHFSDSPSTVPTKNQDKDQAGSQEKAQDKNINRIQDKNVSQKHIKSQGVKQTGVSDKTVDKRVAKEDTQAILKNLEFGNRHIPDDMKKYGPSGGYERPREPDQPTRPSPVRRVTSS